MMNGIRVALVASAVVGLASCKSTQRDQSRSGTTTVTRATTQEGAVTPVAATYKNAELTAEAWAHFNANDHAKAIETAKLCVSDFHSRANADQLALSSSPKPPFGKPMLEGSEEFKAVASRGPLNDVGTCLWIIGRSSELLDMTQEAKEAYEKAKGLSHAACWDRGGFFWSPAEDANARLQGLR